MTEANYNVTLHEDTLDNLVSFLTEYAQVQRAVRNHDKAVRAETVRSTLTVQYATDE